MDPALNDDPERFCDEMLTDDSEMYIPSRGDRHMGREACRAAVRAVLMAVPDRRQRVTATAVSGDTAFVEMFWEGTSSGEAPGWGERRARQRTSRLGLTDQGWTRGERDGLWLDQRVWPAARGLAARQAEAARGDDAAVHIPGAAAEHGDRRAHAVERGRASGCGVVRSRGRCGPRRATRPARADSELHEGPARPAVRSRDRTSPTVLMAGGERVYGRCLATAAKITCHSRARCRDPAPAGPASGVAAGDGTSRGWHLDGGER